MRELRIVIRKTNQIHNNVSKNIIFLLLDQLSKETNTMGALISKTNEISINAKITNRKAKVMFVILQIPTNELYHLIPA